MSVTFHPLRVRSIAPDTAEAVIVSFDVPEPLRGVFGFTQGQYLTLRTQLDGFGWWSWLAFTVLYAAVALTPIPVTIMAVTVVTNTAAIPSTNSGRRSIHSGISGDCSSRVVEH